MNVDQLQCNKATVTNEAKVCEILDKYDCFGFDVEFETALGKTTLELKGLDDDDDDWPMALSLGQAPREENYENEEAYFDALYEAVYEKGGDGFLALLIELAPFLQSPLVILAAAREEAYASAVAWVVQPSATEIEYLCAVTH